MKVPHNTGPNNSTRAQTMSPAMGNDDDDTLTQVCSLELVQSAAASSPAAPQRVDDKLKISTGL